MVWSSLCKEPLKVAPGVNKVPASIVLSVLIQLKIIYLNPRPVAAVGLTFGGSKLWRHLLGFQAVGGFLHDEISKGFSAVLSQVLSPND